MAQAAIISHLHCSLQIDILLSFPLPSANNHITECSVNLLISPDYFYAHNTYYQNKTQNSSSVLQSLILSYMLPLPALPESPASQSLHSTHSYWLMFTYTFQAHALRVVYLYFLLITTFFFMAYTLTSQESIYL